MTNPYELGSVRYNIRDKTTKLKDLVVDDIKQEYQKIPESTRQSISKGAGEFAKDFGTAWEGTKSCLLYTSPSPRDLSTSRMPSSA